MTMSTGWGSAQWLPASMTDPATATARPRHRAERTESGSSNTAATAAAAAATQGGTVGMTTGSWTASGPHAAKIAATIAQAMAAAMRAAVGVGSDLASVGGSMSTHLPSQHHAAPARGRILLIVDHSPIG